MSASTPEKDSSGRSAKMKEQEAIVPVDHSLDHALDLAETLEATKNKLQVYQSEEVPAPKSLVLAIDTQAQALDQTMAVLLQKEHSLIGSILSSGRVRNREYTTLEDSYARVLSMFSDQARPSKLFYLPFLHRRSSSNDELIDFSSQSTSGVHRREKLAQLIRHFIGEHRLLDIGSAPADAMLGLRFGEPLMDWTLGEEDDKHVPALHESLVHGTDLDMSLFTHRQSLLSADPGVLTGGPDWTLGVLPFTLSWPNAKALEMVSFRPDGYEFQEAFENAFDFESECGGYGEPIEPSELNNMRVLMVWQEVVHDSIRQACKKTSRNDMLVVNLGLAIDKESKELDFVEMVIQVGPQQPPEDGTHGKMKFAQSINRAGLLGEMDSDIMDFLLGMDELVGPNVRLVVQRDWSEALSSQPDEDD